MLNLVQHGSVFVIEKVESHDFERAVVRAIPGADTAIVHHDVKAFFAVNCRVHWAHRLTRRVFALLAHHWLNHHLGVFLEVRIAHIAVCAGKITIDPHTVDFSPAFHLILTNDGNVVLGLACHHTRGTPNTRVPIDDHPPLFGGTEGRLRIKGNVCRNLGIHPHLLGESRILFVILHRAYSHHGATLHTVMHLGTHQFISTALHQLDA